MEPLTGFFILEGILLDMIGAYLIVLGLQKVSIIDDPLFQSVNQQLLDKEEVLKLKLLQRDKIRDKLVHQFHTHENEMSLQKCLTLHDIQVERIRVELLSLKNEVMTIATTLQIFKQHSYAFRKGGQGLPFLIGGFLLQGIGVVLQLV